MQPLDRIICAIDVPSADIAVSLVKQLRGHVGVFKLGLELLAASGPDVIDRIRDAGADRIFYDAKLFDIPNTVAGAMRGIASRHPWCVTVHASGGGAILKAAVTVARESAPGGEHTRVIAVTLLTSISEAVLRDELGVTESPDAVAARLARLAYATSCDGVVASPREVRSVRAAVPDPGFLIITPGVRQAGADAGDQARVTTPAEAVRLGADMVVIGRPITGSPSPADAADRIVEEIAQA